MKKILITGASGFIGGYLVEKALSEKLDVYAAIRKNSNRQYLTDTRINFVEINLNDVKELADLFKKHQFDYIIHNAGITKANSRKQYFSINTNCTANMVKAIEMSEISLKRFVFMSSLASYGPADNFEAKKVSNNETPQPITAYGESKLQAEKHIKSSTNLAYAIFRPTAVYGPREKDLLTIFKMINNHLQCSIGLKPQKLTFIYVKDLVSAIFKSLNTDKTKLEFFITDGDSYTPEAFMGIIKKELNKFTIKLKIPTSLVRVIAFTNEKIGILLGNYPAFNLEKVNELSSENWVCDVAPLKKELGFSPKYNLQAGVKETVEWYKNKKWL